MLGRDKPERMPKGTKLKLIVGSTVFIYTVEEDWDDAVDFWEWLGTDGWLEADNGACINIRNILFIEKYEEQKWDVPGGLTNTGND
jgi:hypothetical protein